MVMVSNAMKVFLSNIEELMLLFHFMK